MTTHMAQKYGSRSRSSVVPCCGGRTSRDPAGACTSTTSTSTAFFDESDESEDSRRGSSGDVSVEACPSSCLSPSTVWRELASTSSAAGASELVDVMPGSAIAPNRCAMPATIARKVRKRVTLSMGPLGDGEEKKASAMRDRSRGEQPKRAMLVPDAIPM